MSRIKENIPFPVRINRYIALKGLATRKDADELIQTGLVRINGKKAMLGDRVKSEDNVEILPGRKKSAKKLVYIAYCKPRGIITHSPQKNERSIKQISGFPGKFPIGRLDKDSEGLIVLTNDGRVTERLLHPRFKHEKEYHVTVCEVIPSTVKRLFERGVKNESELLTAKKVTVLNQHTLSIILTEGKKHQIRRMLACAHLTVKKLVRIRIMGVHLGSLKPGGARVLSGKARHKFLADIGLQDPKSGDKSCC